MKKMQIFEPAMCCDTGLCGVGVNPELLRISTVLNTLKTHGIIIERYNLSSAPVEFIKNAAVNKLINEKGVEQLPAVILDGEVIIAGRYPKNEELIEIFDLSSDILKVEKKSEKVKDTSKKSGGCNCKGGCD